MADQLPPHRRQRGEVLVLEVPLPQDPRRDVERVRQGARHARRPRRAHTCTLTVEMVLQCCSAAAACAEFAATFFKPLVFVPCRHHSLFPDH